MTGTGTASLRIGLVIRSLNRGGAERQFVNLAIGLHRRGHTVRVIVFRAGGPLQAELVAAGVTVRSLGKRGLLDLIGPAAAMARLARADRLEVLYAFMADANLLSSFAGWFHRRLGVIWGVRSADLDLSLYPPSAKVAFEASRWLARTADLIIANSAAGAEYHGRKGYPRARIRVVPNGIDTDVYRIRADAREPARARFGLPGDAIAVGMVARIDPIKGHDTFIEAAARLAARQPGARFLCIGGGDPGLAEALRARAAAASLGDRLQWVGPVTDMSAAYAALDLAVSCSRSEGFPNAVAEAMACGVPCVVTDAGDSRDIVGDLGVVVGPNDPGAMADAIDRAIRTRTPAWGAACRRRIEENFSVDRMVANTERIIAEREARA